MKKLLILLLVLISQIANSQTLTHRPVSAGTNTGGYYEYLPKGYDGLKQYPIILFIHGLGELGSGQADITSVLRNGLPMYLNTNAAFKDTFKAIVIAPQFRQWPNANDLESVLTYAKANYRVDLSRIYISGLSMGGAATWGYMGYNEDRSSKIAAILPVCGAAAPDSYAMGLIAKLGTGVWATHNADDGTVTVANTNGWVDGINARTPLVRANKTIWPSGGHNAWTRTYDPASKEFDGSNVYAFLFKFSKGAVPITPPITFTALKIATGSSIPGWTYDQQFISSNANGWGNNTMGVMLPIRNTTEQTLYNYERFGTFSYSIPVPNNTYTVTLHFAELFYNATGKRVFSVDAEGVRRISNLDLVAEAGYLGAIQKTFDVTVSDLRLDLSFIPTVDKAKLTAIEIYEKSSAVGYSKISIIEYRDSITNTLIKSYTDTLKVPFKVIVK
jgi:hypothetical protein